MRSGRIEMQDAGDGKTIYPREVEDNQAAAALEHEGDWDPNASDSIMLGYATGYRGDALMDLHENQPTRDPMTNKHRNWR